MFVDMVSGPDSWGEDMEPSDQPLALPLPAMVIGHSDADNVIEAGARYLDLINEALRLTRDTLSDFDAKDIPEDFPEKIPAPERSVEGDDVSFRWNILTETFRADESLRAGTRVSKDLLVMNFHDGQAKRLTQGNSESNLFGPAKTDDASALIVFLDNRVLIEKLRQWVDYGATVADDDPVFGDVILDSEVENPFDFSEYEAERDTLQFSEEQMLEAVNCLWAMVECFQGISMRTWEVPEGTATEILFKFEDAGP